MPKDRNKDSQSDIFTRYENNMKAKREQNKKKKNRRAQFRFAYGRNGKSGWIHRHGFKSAREMKDTDWNKFNFDFSKAMKNPKFFKIEEARKQKRADQQKNKLASFAYGNKNKPGWLKRHGFKSYREMTPKDKLQLKMDFKTHQKRLEQKAQQKLQERKQAPIKNRRDARRKLHLESDNRKIKAIEDRKRMSKSTNPEDQSNEFNRKMSSIDTRFPTDSRVFALAGNVKMHHGHVVRDAQGRPMPGAIVKTADKLGSSNSKFAQFFGAVFHMLAETNDEMINSNLLNNISPIGMHRNLVEYKTLKHAKKDKKRLIRKRHAHLIGASQGKGTEQSDKNSLKSISNHHTQNPTNLIAHRRRARLIKSRQQGDNGLGL